MLDMKKHLKLVGLFFCLFYHTICWSQVKKQVSIGILGDKVSEDYQNILLKLQNEIRSVVGEEATISFQEIMLNDFDYKRAQSNYRSLVQSDVDIILSFGLINNLAIYNEKVYSKPTIVFGSVNRNLLNIEEGQNTSKINNINYVITPIFYAKDLDAFYSLFDYQSIGIIVDEIVLETIPLKDYLDTYFSDKTSTYRLIPIAEGRDIDSLLVDLDAVYITGGNYLSDSEFKKMVNEINDRKLPSFSLYGIRDLKRGVLATNQPDSFLDNFIRRIALNVEAIIKGVNPSELPLYLDYKEQLTVNYITGNNIGFPFRFSSLSKVDFMSMDQEAKFDVKYSLLDIMNGLVEKNLSLSAQRKEIELSNQDVKISKSNYLPNVIANGDGVYIDPKVSEVSRGTNPELSATASVQLQQTLYSEAAGANITISEKQLESQKEQYNATELDAILNGALSYFNALIFKTNVNIQNENLKTTRRNLEIAQLNFLVGESSKYDELRFKSEVATNTFNFVNANKDYQQSLYTINQLLNNPIDQRIDIEQAEINKGVFSGYSYDNLLKLIDNPTLRPGLIDFLIEEALRNSPELKNIGFSLEAIERSYKLSSSGRYIPTVSLQGQYGLELARSGAGVDYPPILGIPPDNTYNLGLNIAFPVFQQNRNNINRQTAKIQQDQFELFEMDTRLAIEKNINDLIAEIMSRIANIEISKVAEEAAKEALFLTQNSYAEGESLLIELVDAQSTYLSAQLASSTAIYNYLIAFVTLERSIGYFFLMHTNEENNDFMQRANQFILERK